MIFLGAIACPYERVSGNIYAVSKIYAFIGLQKMVIIS